MLCSTRSGVRKRNSGTSPTLAIKKRIWASPNSPALFREKSLQKSKRRKKKWSLKRILHENWKDRVMKEVFESTKSWRGPERETTPTHLRWSRWPWSTGLSSPPSSRTRGIGPGRNWLSRWWPRKGTVKGRSWTRLEVLIVRSICDVIMISWIINNQWISSSIRVSKSQLVFSFNYHWFQGIWQLHLLGFSRFFRVRPLVQKQNAVLFWWFLPPHKCPWLIIQWYWCRCTDHLCQIRGK